MNNRRTFLKKSTLVTGLLSLQQFPFEAFGKRIRHQKLTILHTNDVHSRLDPFPLDGSSLQGLGGVVAREKIISEIRKNEEHVLLLDAGDIFQGTPYFNFFKGEPEMKVMSMLHYDCATIGNHDFDNGIDGLTKQMEHANFSFVNCNYDVENTTLKDKLKPFKIIQKGDIKIGILGVGIELNGLVPDKLFGELKYAEPIACANRVAHFLKTKKRCDYVICLSHLGFESKSNKVCDKDLARDSANIDLIIGGHSHTLMTTPFKTKNRNNQEIIINQVGWGGTHLGVINIYFDNKKDYHYVSDFSSLEVVKTSV
jgi:5'-nucleotidase